MEDILVVCDLAPHQHHTDYAGCLAGGRSIGRGQIAAACKNLIGRPLTANAACRSVRGVTRMAGLCSQKYRHHWAADWESP